MSRNHLMDAWLRVGGTGTDLVLLLAASKAAGVRPAPDSPRWADTALVTADLVASMDRETVTSAFTYLRELFDLKLVPAHMDGDLFEFRLINFLHQDPLKMNGHQDKSFYPTAAHWVQSALADKESTLNDKFDDDEDDHAEWYEWTQELCDALLHFVNRFDDRMRLWITELLMLKDMELWYLDLIYVDGAFYIETPQDGRQRYMRRTAEIRADPSVGTILAAHHN